MKSTYSIRIRKDTDQKKTPNLDTYEKNKFGIVRLYFVCKGYSGFMTNHICMSLNHWKTNTNN